MPPTDPAPWSGVRDALHYGPSTPQSNPGVPRAVSPLSTASANLPPESEDCLVLNVWTPGAQGWTQAAGVVLVPWRRLRAAARAPRPGTDGANLARRGDVVVVTINHRLNVLGFTYLAEFGGSDFAASGDAGMLDIVHALRLGAQQHRAVWRRSEHGDDLRPVRRRPQSGHAARHAIGQGTVSPRGDRERPHHPVGGDRDQATRVAGMLLAQAECQQGRKCAICKKCRWIASWRRISRWSKTWPAQDQMTEGFSPTVDGKAIPQHPFHPAASPISADVPLDAGLNAHGNDAAERRSRLLAG